MARAVDLVREDLRELGTAVHDAAGRPTEPFGVYAVRAEAAESELARAVERTVFDEFFGNSAELLASEYGTYEPSTLFFCVLDHRRKLPAGMMRLVLPSPRGLKSLGDMEHAWGVRLDQVLARTELELVTEQVWDIATIAVAADYRGKATDGLVSLALYQAVVQAARRCGARWFVTILDLTVLDLIQGLTSAPFHRFAGVEPREYLDSPASVPVYCDLAEYLPRLAAADPSMHEILGDGRGLEAAVRPPEWAPVLAAAGRTELAEDALRR